jgi:hypothetical protein
MTRTKRASTLTDWLDSSWQPPVLEVKTLGETVPGDVFYLAADPSFVWERCEVHAGDDYCFITTGSECWDRLEDVGTGDPYQAVVVVHNVTRGAGRK